MSKNRQSSQRKKTSGSNNAGIRTFIVFLIIIAVIGLIVFAIDTAAKIQKRNSCESSGKVYVESSNSCRDKTVSELFSEKCRYGVKNDDEFFTCAQIKARGLEKAYLDGTIVMHGSDIYEEGTYEEVEAGKKVGDYCLTASDTWNHIGEKRCVVFHYSYLACSNGYCFLNEKKNYKNGFVAFFGKYRMYSWKNFENTFLNQGPILVCGQIYSYQGHPEIKITGTGQFLLNPNRSSSGSYTVYRYSCK